MGGRQTTKAQVTALLDIPDVRVLKTELNKEGGLW